MPIRRKPLSKDRYSALTGMRAEDNERTPEMHDAMVLERRKRMGRRGVTGEPVPMGDKTVAEQESELTSRRKNLYKKLRASSPSKFKKLKELGYAPKE